MRTLVTGEGNERKSSAWQTTLEKSTLGHFVTAMEGHSLSVGKDTGRYLAKGGSGLTGCLVWKRVT